MVKVKIIVGGFGSGKSEYAVNLALEWATHPGPKTAIVDLDLVNAYFRIREVQQLLEAQQIRCVVPSDTIRFSDMPIAGPGIAALINDGNYQTIIDVGGDEVGATALGSYRSQLTLAQPEVELVVNPYRPYTQTVKLIVEMKESIEYCSSIPINAVVSNPNIGTGTTLEQVLSKHAIVEEAAREMNLPVRELLVLQELYENHSLELNTLGVRIRPLKIYLSPQWLLKQQKEE